MPVDRLVLWSSRAAGGCKKKTLEEFRNCAGCPDVLFRDVCLTELSADTLLKSGFDPSQMLIAWASRIKSLLDLFGCGQILIHPSAAWTKPVLDACGLANEACDFNQMRFTPKDIMFDSAPERANKLLATPLQDRHFNHSKTLHAIARDALEIGLASWMIDTSDARCFFATHSAHALELASAIEEHIHEALDVLDVKEVFSLDLDWLLTPMLFTQCPQIEKIHSQWFDDVFTWLQHSGTMPGFGSCDEMVEKVKSPKVRHLFYGLAQSFEADLLGITNTRLSYLAAGKDFFETAQDALHPRAAFLGGPGTRDVPCPRILEKIRQGAELLEIRTLARTKLLKEPSEEVVQWFKEEPQVRTLLEQASEAKINFPASSCYQLLRQSSRSCSVGWEYLRERDCDLRASRYLQRINAYDRPAWIMRAHAGGRVDVFSSGKEWAQYGIHAHGSVRPRDMPCAYSQYLVHLNAPSCLREAPCNEKLFEISASARVSINLYFDEVAAQFPQGGIKCLHDLSELENYLKESLDDPAKLLEQGLIARETAQNKHRWEHRLCENIFNETQLR